MSFYAIILAAGSGQRLNQKMPKCLVKLNDKEIYKYSLEVFASIKKIKKIVLVVPKQYANKIKTNNVLVVVGGKDRNESFELGLKALKNLNENDRIIVHDAARIFVKKQDIIKLINSKQEQGTLCYKGIQSQLGKSDLIYKNYHIQTPQFCSYKQYLEANVNPKGKDLFTYLNLKHKKNDFIISSNKHLNFKITYSSDLSIAFLLLKNNASKLLK